MSKELVSQVVSEVQIDFLNTSNPTVSSLDVARHFQKRHAHVLREIEKLRSILPKSFHEPNFGRMFMDIETHNGASRKSSYYTLTRDAFSLLVMGFTGTAAIRWKLKYIEAFNALEHEVRNHVVELAHEAGYKHGLDEGFSRMVPVLTTERQDAYARGLKEGKSKKHDRLLKVRKALDYMQNKGLKLGEAATLVGMSRQCLAEQLRAFGVRIKQGVLA